MNTTEVKVIVLERSPKGYPYVTESGGAMTHQGEATVYCDESGKPLKPFYVPSGGHLSNGSHAFFSPRKGMIRIDVQGKNASDGITVMKLLCWHENPETGNWEGKYEILADLNSCDPHPEAEEAEYPEDVASFHFPHLRDAISAACSKSGAYHCRSAYYAKQ
jgi:hypothetical protein